MKKVRSFLVPVLIAVFVAVMIFSVWQIVKTQLEYKEADTLYFDLQDKYVETVPETTPGTKESEETTDAPDPSEPVTESSDTTSEPETETVPITVDFASLLADNGDVVGWIFCPDTPINYPVVQGKDNNEYLRHDLNGRYLVSGTLFVDYRNGSIGEDTNFVIYGHNMKNQTMFGTILKYKEQSYYNAHPLLYYLTPEQNYMLEPIAGLVVSTGDMIYQTSPDMENFPAYVEKHVDKSGFRSEATYTPGDILVTLSTCSYEFDTARYVLVCKLTEIE